MEQQHVVSFSGGKDSTAMLFMMLEKGYQVDRIISVDTTKEFPAMYEHIAEVQRRIGIPIEVVKLDYDYWFGEHVKTRGKRKGTRGYGWPTMLGRWCTAMKQEAFACAVSRTTYDHRRRYGTRKAGATVYTGIAADETKRFEKNKESQHRHPLVEMGVTEAQALEYCKKLGFTWGGLYDEGRSRLSCYCCPLQRVGEIRLTHDLHPDLWKKMQEMDALSPDFKFKSGRTLSYYTDLFEKDKK